MPRDAAAHAWPQGVQPGDHRIARSEQVHAPGQLAHEADSQFTVLGFVIQH